MKDQFLLPFPGSDDSGDSGAPPVDEGDIRYPELSEATWRELWKLAGAVRDLEPWNLVAEGEFFGVADPATGEIGLVQVLGRDGEYVSVQFLLPPEGIRFLNDLIRNGVPDMGVATYDMRMVECEFVPKAELGKWDREGIGAHGLKRPGRRRNNWPMFRAREPEFVPWPPDEGEARLLARALRLIPAFVESRPDLDRSYFVKMDANGMPKIPIYRLRDGGVESAAEDWQPAPGFLPVAPLKPLPEVPEDEVWNARLAAIKVHKNEVWELGQFFLPEPIAYGGKPGFGTLALTVNPAGDEPPNPAIANPQEPRIPALRQALANYAERVGHLPGKLQVVSPLAVLAFENLAGDTGMETEQVGLAPALENVANMVMEGLRMGSGEFDIIDQLADMEEDEIGEALFSGKLQLPPAMMERLAELAEGGGYTGSEPGSGSHPAKAPVEADYRPPKSGQRYQLRIDLSHAKPPIWRRITIPVDASFFDLHVAIQEAMGWMDSHLHEFEIRERGETLARVVWQPGKEESFPFGPQVEEFGELSTTLEYAVSLGAEKFHYVYDFGDDWEHTVKVEKVVEGEAGDVLPKLLKGRGACPPEDCGGLPGFYAILDGERDVLEMYEPEEITRIQKAVFDPDEVQFSPAGSHVAEKVMRNAFG